MTVEEAIYKLEKLPKAAELLICIGPDGPMETDGDKTWLEVAFIEDAGWRDEDGSTPIIGAYAGKVVMD